MPLPFLLVEIYREDLHEKKSLWRLNKGILSQMALAVDIGQLRQTFYSSPRTRLSPPPPIRPLKVGPWARTDGQTGHIDLLFRTTEQ